VRVCLTFTNSSAEGQEHVVLHCTHNYLTAAGTSLNAHGSYEIIVGVCVSVKLQGDFQTVLCWKVPQITTASWCPAILRQFPLGFMFFVFTGVKSYNIIYSAAY